MAGTIFIDEKTEYVASRLYPGRITAFVADALGYESLTREQREQVPQVLRVWLRYRSEKYFGPQRTPPGMGRRKKRR